ncbi:MAG: hypothetical protein KDB07_08640, partial [Planctomycetes bacterium]|nr:hypothetical protein [Planctomycetota bacterium]
MNTNKNDNDSNTIGDELMHALLELKGGQRPMRELPDLHDMAKPSPLRWLTAAGLTLALAALGALPFVDFNKREETPKLNDVSPIVAEGNDEPEPDPKQGAEDTPSKKVVPDGKTGPSNPSKDDENPYVGHKNPGSSPVRKRAFSAHSSNSSAARLSIVMPAPMPRRPRPG